MSLGTSTGNKRDFHFQGTEDGVVRKELIEGTAATFTWKWTQSNPLVSFTCSIPFPTGLHQLDGHTLPHLTSTLQCSAKEIKGMITEI